MATLTNKQLLELIFGSRWGDAWVLGFRGDPYQNKAWGGGRASVKLPKMTDDMCAYWVVGMIAPGEVRAAGNVTEVHAILLDDIGTKAKEADARQLLGSPTVSLETSPGNYQWVYKLKTPIAPGLFDRIMKDLSARELLDKGVKDCARYARLPVGVNGKKGSTWAVRVAELNESVVLDGEELAGRVLGVSTASEPDDYSGLGFGPGKFTADLSKPDQWLVALDALGLVKGPSHKDGVVDIVCPWVHEHTARADTGTSYLGSGRFQCHHSHCEAKKSGEFHCEIVARLETDGVTAGLTSGQGFLAKLAFTDRAEDETLAVAERVEKEAEASEERVAAAWDQVFDRFVYVRDADRFVDLQEPDILLTGKGFATMIRSLVPVGRSGEKSAEAQFINKAPGRCLVRRLGYQPGKSVLPDGSRVLNQWRPGTLVPVMADENDVKPWLDHLERLVPDPDAREVYLDFLSFILQNPGHKIGWAIVTQGEQGTGKDTLLAPVIEALGSSNVQSITMEDFRSGWTPWLKAQLILFQEVANSARFDLYNDLKPFLSRPPDTVTVRDKYVSPYAIENNQVWMLNTNKSNAIALEGGDRRFFVYASPAQRPPKAYFDGLWTWLKGGGSAQVAGFLMLRTISAGFSPHACPTPAAAVAAKAAMAVEALNAAGQWVVETFGSGSASGRSLVQVTDILAAAGRHGVPDMVKRSINRASVLEALRVMGARQVQDGAQIKLSSGKVVRLWALERGELFDQMALVQVRDRYEKEAGSAARDAFAG